MMSKLPIKSTLSSQMQAEAFLLRWDNRTDSLNILLLFSVCVYTYIYTYVCVCVCVCPSVLLQNFFITCKCQKFRKKGRVSSVCRRSYLVKRYGLSQAKGLGKVLGEGPSITEL